jgi:hypothetical protein
VDALKLRAAASRAIGTNPPLDSVVFRNPADSDLHGVA